MSSFPKTIFCWKRQLASMSMQTKCMAVDYWLNRGWLTKTQHKILADAVIEKRA